MPKFSLIASSLFYGMVAFAADKELCIFINEKGVMQQTASRDLVPARFRNSAKCFQEKSLNKDLPKTGDTLAKPEEITLKGNVRKDSIATSVGRIELRWPRKVELLFGRTPQRAMAEAGATLSRVLKKPGFPSALQSLDLDWNVVFLDEELPDQQIPAFLVSNCHPAWMTPPANLYVVGQRVAAGCGNQKSVSNQVADAQLMQVLLHEMGHAVEYKLLEGKGALDRMRAEGFACWFEQYASGFSSLIPSGSVKSFYTALARESFKESPGIFLFQGSGFDYARAALYFRLVEERRGVPGVVSLYKQFVDPSTTLPVVVGDVLNLRVDKLQNELLRLVK